MKVKVYVYRLDIQPLEGGPVGAKAPTGEQIWVERRENHGHLPGDLLSLCPGIVFAHWQCCFNWSAFQINYLDESDVNGFQVRECILCSFTCVRVHFVYFMFVRVYSLHFFVYCAWCLDNFQIYVNDSPTFLCTAMTHTPTLTTKANTCYTGETLTQVSITFSSSRGCHFLGAWRSSLCEELGCE